MRKRLLVAVGIIIFGISLYGDTHESHHGGEGSPRMRQRPQQMMMGMPMMRRMCGMHKMGMSKPFMMFNDQKLAMDGVSEVTRRKIRKIIFEAKRELMGIKFSINEEKIKLWKEYGADKVSKKKTSDLIKKVADLKKQKALIKMSAKDNILRMLPKKLRKNIRKSHHGSTQSGMGRHSE